MTAWYADVAMLPSARRSAAIVLGRYIGSAARWPSPGQTRTDLALVVNFSPRTLAHAVYAVK
jgi:hypothetical protein